jgi:hypothetical protein
LSNLRKDSKFCIPGAFAYNEGSLHNIQGRKEVIDLANTPVKNKRRRGRRKRKLRYLRQRLEQTTNVQDRQRLIAKMRRVSKTAPVPEK